MSQGGEPITRCPVCRYDLTGLPKNHRCPECGFEYDESMRVWMPVETHVRKLTLSICLAFAVALVFLAATAQFVLAPTWASKRAHIGTLLQALCIAAVAYYWHRANWSPSFTIVSRKGLVYKQPLRAWQLVPWTDTDFRQGFTRPLRQVNGKLQRVPLPGIRLEDRDALGQAIEIAKLAASYPRDEEGASALQESARATAVPLTCLMRLRLLLNDLIENWWRPSQP